MKYKYTLLPATILLCINLSTGYADIDKTLEQCAECHGKSGNSKKEDMPTISGISQVYFIDTMTAFKEKERPASTAKRTDNTETNMQLIASKLDEAQITKLAKYFSEQKFILKPQAFDPEKAKKGKHLHKKYCDKCHEKGGSSSADDAGILAGQKKLYLKKALDEIIIGDRIVSKKMTRSIKKIQNKYGNDGFDQLIEYYISQGTSK